MPARRQRYFLSCWRLPVQTVWWARLDSNQGPEDYESTALTAELRAQTIEKTTEPVSRLLARL